MGIVFLLGLIGMVFSYPAYFFFLFEFKRLLKRDHPEIWSQRGGVAMMGELQVAYKALRDVKGDLLDGVHLSGEVVSAHRAATILLHVGLSLFLIVLFLGLFESVSH